MKKTLAALAVVMLATSASAGGLDVRGAFASVSASGIVSSLPTNAAKFEALTGQVNQATLKVTGNMIDAETISGTLQQVDGWRNTPGGFIGAAGFAAIGGVFEK